MAGHAGKAFWFSKAAKQFVTTDYYYDQFPKWVDEWNAKKVPESYANTTWELMHPIETYLFADRDNQSWEQSPQGFERTFPHAFGVAESPKFPTLLTVSPAGDEITTDFAKTLITAEGLGDDEVTDYLGVSYSATDYIGHFFGPSSLESEDNILRLDRTIAYLLGHVDKEVGLANVRLSPRYLQI